nr:MAG TPA: hypothetical protein [Caudoviricetes sp.]
MEARRRLFGLKSNLKQRQNHQKARRIHKIN